MLLCKRRHAADSVKNSASFTLAFSEDMVVNKNWRVCMRVWGSRFTAQLSCGSRIFFSQALGEESLFKPVTVSKQHKQYFMSQPYNTYQTHKIVLPINYCCNSVIFCWMFFHIHGNWLRLMPGVLEWLITLVKMNSGLMGYRKEISLKAFPCYAEKQGLAKLNWLLFCPWLSCHCFKT